MAEIQRCPGCSLSEGRHAEDCPISPPHSEVSFDKAEIVSFLTPFGGLGKLVAGVMQMLGVERAERDKVRSEVDAAVASNEPCFIVFELGRYRYRVRIA